MTATKKKPTVRDMLARKLPRQSFYDVLIADPAEPTEAVARQKNLYTRAVLVHGEHSEQAAAALQALEHAQTKLADCTYRIVLQNLPAADFEALVKAHPPTRDGRERGEQWNPQTFQPALIAACAVDRAMTAEQWAEELATERWSLGDQNGLFSAALNANV